MGGDVSRFGVDIAELVDLVDDLGATERKLETLTNDIERQIATLHTTWEGLAAAAQREAQQEWNQGMQAMRDALAHLKAAVDVARQNYDGAVSDNLAMWRQL